MRYTEFRIENYKAVEDVTVSTSKPVVPLIGINESGKTTVLQGILAFDKAKDRLLDGSHVEVKNKYRTKSRQQECRLTAKARPVSPEEAGEIIRSAKMNTKSELYAWAKGLLESGEPVSIRRTTDPDGSLSGNYELLDAPKGERGTAWRTGGWSKRSTGAFPTSCTSTTSTTACPTRSCSTRNTQKLGS